MGSTGWDDRNQGLHPGSDEDFQQFLDMNIMEGLADCLQFDFPNFINTSPSAHNLIPASSAPPRDATLDTPMSDTGHTSGLLTSWPVPDPMPSTTLIDPTIGIRYSTLHAAPPSETSGLGPIHPPSPTDAISESDAQIQFLQQQRRQQRRQVEEQNIVFLANIPPTPQSLELQAGTCLFAPNDPCHKQKQMQQQRQQQSRQPLYERHQQVNEQQDLSFTPLVSPAVTPLDAQFSTDTQYTIPGAYFSPLTSPALHAQVDHTSIFDLRLAATSLVDMDLETLTGLAPAAPGAQTLSIDSTTKARKNNASKAGRRSVRQSPIIKAQRRKMTTTPVISTQVLDKLAETLGREALSSPSILQKSQQNTPLSVQGRLLPAAAHPDSLSSSTGGTDSEIGSISPENLNEMPPPPLPKSRSTRPSPYLHPQHSQHDSVAPTGDVPVANAVPGALGSSFPSPATPASLMKLAPPQQKSHKPLLYDSVRSHSGTASAGNSVEGPITSGASVDNKHIEHFELPEPLTTGFQKAPNAGAASGNNTPTLDTLTAAQTLPTFQASPSPDFVKPVGDATPSTPNATLTPTFVVQSNRKTSQMLSRGGAKRPSISSVQVSPALRPKISPNIQPLFPGGVTAAEDRASHLLSTKSNYQNIIEGNTVPGVSYPSELSTNLTSKRTSHKIAEQSRRNRINSALQEMATLLARPPKEGKGESEEREAGDRDGGTAPSATRKESKQGGSGGSNNDNNGPNSKASTVEMAIDYIKQLRKEVAEMAKRAEDAEEKLRLKEQASN